MKTRLLTLFLSFLSFNVIGQTLVFNSQEEINSYQLGSGNHIGVVIDGQDIVSLEPLLGMKTCRSITIENTALESLSGLDSLNQAYDIYSIGSTTYRNGFITIKDNLELTSLHGLENVYNTSHISLINNPKLTSTNGLNIKKYEIDLYHWEQGGGQLFVSLSSTISIINNASLVSLNGFENLTVVQELYIEDNPELIDMSSMSNLSRVEDNGGYFSILQIKNNDALRSLEVFSGIDRFRGDLVIIHNELLDTLGFQNEFSIIRLEVSENSSLKSLGDFGLSWPHFFIIKNNAVLESIDLGDVTYSSSIAVVFEIQNNPFLQLCNTDYICESFVDGSHSYDMRDNGSSCETIEQVIDACGVEASLVNGILKLEDDCELLYNEEIDFGVVEIHKTNTGSLVTKSQSDGRFSFIINHQNFESFGIVPEEFNEDLLGPFPSSILIDNPQQISSIDTFFFEYCVDYYSQLSIEILADNCFSSIEKNDYTIRLTNEGTIIDSGLVTLRFLQDVDFVEYADMPGASIIGNELTWNFSNLNSGRSLFKFSIKAIGSINYSELQLECEVQSLLTFENLSEDNELSKVFSQVKRDYDFNLNIRQSINEEVLACTYDLIFEINSECGLLDSNEILFFPIYQEDQENFEFRDGPQDTVRWSSMNGTSIIEEFLKLTSKVNNHDTIYFGSIFRDDLEIHLDTFFVTLDLESSYRLLTQANVDRCSCLNEIAALTIGPYQDIHGNFSSTDIRNLDSLSNLIAINNLWIAGTNLSTLQGLDNVNHLESGFSVYANDQMESIESFNPQTTNVANILVLRNQLLSLCNSDFICSALNSLDPDLDISISINAQGCDSESEIKVNCEGYHEFVGSVRIGEDCDFLFDTLEFKPQNLVITDSITSSIIGSVNDQGYFSFQLNTNVIYDLILLPPDIFGYIATPSSYYIGDITGVTSIDTIDFAFCPDYYSDLSTSIENVDPFLEIGSETSYTLCYTNNGTIIDTATLFFEYEDINEIEAYLEYLEIDGGVLNDFELSWDIIDLAPLESECKNITVKIPDDFPLGDSLKYKLSIQSVSNFDIKNQEDNSTRGTQEVGIGDLMIEVFTVVSRCNIDYKIWISNTSDFAHQTDLLFRKTDASMNGKFEYTSIDGASMQGDSLLWQTPLMQPGVRDTFEVSLRINKNIAKDEDIIMTVEMLGLDNDLSNNKVEKENSVTTFWTTLNIFSQPDADNCPCIHVVNDLVKVRDDNGIINNLDSLLNLEVINGKLSIGPVGGFQDLEGLSNLRQLSSLEVFESDIISINGLEQISTLNGIKILTNNNLIDLSGLENVETLNNDLWIRYNDALESITALNPNIHDIDILKIDYNPLLEVCDSDFICAVMAVDGISKSVVGNNGECTEEETLLEACGILSLEDQSHLKQISVFPNPASNRIHLQSNTPLDDFDISLKNLDGKTLHKLAADSSTLDVSDYPSGLYLITIESEGTRVVKKIVIE